MVMAIPPPPGSGNTNIRIKITADTSDVKPAMESAAQEIKNLGAETEQASGKMGILDRALSTSKNALSSMAGGLGEVVSIALEFAPAVGVVAVAALGSLAVAAHEGAAESQRLTKELIMTGNSVGMTIGQIEAMASGIGDLGEVTQGKATLAIEAFIKAGSTSAEVMGKAAEAAVLLEKYGGVALDKTAAAFAKLGEDPVKASIELNKQTNFLTASLFEQIKALDDQGKSAEASALAQSKAADDSIQKMQDVKATLSDFQQLWNDVETAAKKAWDAIKDSGRAKTTGDLIKEVMQDLERGTTDAYGGDSGARIALEKLQRKQQEAEATAKASAAQKDQTDAMIRWRQEGDKYLSKQQQMQREINKAREDGNAAGIEAVKIEQRIADIKEKYADKAKAPKKTQFDRDLEAVDRLKFDARAADAGLAPQTMKELDALNAVYKRTNMSQAEYLQLASAAMANDSMIAANKRAVNAELKAEAEATQYLNELQSRFNRSNQAKSDGMLILPENVARLNAELRKVDETATETRNRLTKAFGDGRLSASDYAQKIDELNRLVSEQKDKVIDLNAQQDRMNESWAVGAQRALQKYQDIALNVAAASEQAFSRAFSSMEDALVQFAMTGKMNFSNFANSVVADIIRIQTRAAMSKAIDAGGGASGLLSAIGGFLGFSSAKVDSNALDLGGGVSISSWKSGGGLSFEGGGYTGTGSRVGGLDGRGGFLAMLHPDETVTDHTRSQSGGGITLNLNVSNQAAQDGYQVSANARQNGNGVDLELMIARATRQTLSDDLSRNGLITQGIASTFGLRRKS